MEAMSNDAATAALRAGCVSVKVFAEYIFSSGICYCWYVGYVSWGYLFWVYVLFVCVEKKKKRESRDEGFIAAQGGNARPSSTRGCFLERGKGRKKGKRASE